MKLFGRTKNTGAATPFVFEGRHDGTWLTSHYVRLIETLFAVIVGLNVTDLWTSTVALGRGLNEGNTLVVGLANQLGLSIVDGLALAKIACVLGAFGASLLGMRVRNIQVRKTAMAVMIFLALILIAVSVNNSYQIIN